MENLKKSNRRVKVRNIILALLSLAVVAVAVMPYLRTGAPAADAPPQFLHVDGKIFIPETSPLRERIAMGAVQTDLIRREVAAPATVEANPSKRGNIFPPAGGRIVRLFVNMGQSVRAGQALFEIYSPDIAEVQTEFISARRDRKSVV